MRRVWVFCFAVGLAAQTQTGADFELATRMAQLMESTAAAVPGLTHAAEAIQQRASATVIAMQRTPDTPALEYRLMNQVRAYLALSDSLPHPESLPAVADQQFAELREDLQRMQRGFEAALLRQNSRGQEQNADPSDLKRYAGENAQLLPAAKLPRVVFFGAATASFWRLNEYFTGRDFINRGIAGQTSLQMLGRFMQDVTALRPRAVVILCGSSQETAGSIESNLSAMGTLAKASGIRVLLASMPPGERAATETKEMNRWIQEYCRREGFIYLDYYTALANSEGKFQPDLSDDGQNPNAKGYRVMSPIVLDAINRSVAASPDISEDARQKRRFRLPGK